MCEFECRHVGHSGDDGHHPVVRAARGASGAVVGEEARERCRRVGPNRDRISCVATFGAASEPARNTNSEGLGQSFSGGFGSHSGHLRPRRATG